MGIQDMIQRVIKERENPKCYAFLPENHETLLAMAKAKDDAGDRTLDALTDSLTDELSGAFRALRQSRSDRF